MDLQVVFLYPKKARLHGLQQDALLLERTLNLKRSPRHADPLEPPSQCDIAVHLEIPIYGWMPWATKNFCVVNPEWWNDEWAPYLKHMDLLIFKCQEDADRFSCDVPKMVLPWTSPVHSYSFDSYPRPKGHSTGALFLTGASVHKRMAANVIAPLWKETWPPLHIYTNEPLDNQPITSNVTVHIEDLDEADIHALQALYPCHIVASASEALSLIAHEGMAAGAFLIANDLPTYKALDPKSSYIIPSTLVPNKAGVRDTFEKLPDSLEAAIKAFLASDIEATRTRQKKYFNDRFASFKKAVKELFGEQNKKSLVLPPIIQDADLPSISVVTLLYNRRKFVDLALHNLLVTDYPKEKIEWVVVEDSDITEEQASDKVIKFGRNAAPMSVAYIPLEAKTDIGEKRNIGVKRAQNDIILMMDDDDHYPASSFRRRVSWLLKHPWNPQAGVCTTIACYDLVRGISAVNSPPFTLGLKERVSEATLVFKKSWWEQKGFPSVSMAEGEGFVEGREDEVLEIPPQQCIVAFSHGKNLSSRKIPEAAPSCFWGFPKEFLTFIHGLAGIAVEEDTRVADVKLVA